MTEAHALAAHTASLYHRLGFTTEEIHVTGGCLAHLPWFRAKFAAFLTEQLPEASLSMTPVSSVNGAWAYYTARSNP